MSLLKKVAPFVVSLEFLSGAILLSVITTLTVFLFASLVYPIFLVFFKHYTPVEIQQSELLFSWFVYGAAIYVVNNVLQLVKAFLMGIGKGLITKRESAVANRLPMAPPGLSGIILGRQSTSGVRRSERL